MKKLLVGMALFVFAACVPLERDSIGCLSWNRSCLTSNQNPIGGGSGGDGGNTPGLGPYTLEKMSDFVVIDKGYNLDMPANNPTGRRRVANDIWGWTDPETGKEYALLGTNSKVAIVDISDAANPVLVADLVSHNSASNLWRDIKTYQNYMLVVSEAGGHGLQIFDLTKLRDIQPNQMPALFGAGDYIHYAEFGNAHNIVVNEESGFAFVVGSSQGEHCTGGLHMVNIQNPEAPSFSGCASPGVAAEGIVTANIELNEEEAKCFTDDPNGKRPVDEEEDDLPDDVIKHDESDACGVFYTHDAHCVIYKGPDEEHRGKEICIISNGPAGLDGGRTDDYHILDVTNKNAPILLSTFVNNMSPGYAHQAWFTEDHAFVLANDETDELDNRLNTRTFVLDARDLDDIKLHFIHTHETRSIDHNLYVKNNKVYMSNYEAGLRVLDLSNLKEGSMNEVAFYDTNPTTDRAAFNGSWSNYPYFASGKVVVSHIETGSLIVLQESGE